MINDLRDFLAILETRDNLVRIRQPVQDGHEIFSILWRLTEMRGPAVVFENVAGKGIPVVSNLFGTLDRFALSCGFEPGLDIYAYRDLFLERLKPEYWHKPINVTKAPCHEVVIQDRDVDLTKFPILQWHPDDGGPYITLPIVITEDVRFGINASIYRMMIHNKSETGMMCNIFQDQGIYLARARESGRESIPCAVAIGLDPALYVAAVTKIPLNACELDFAASLRGGRPVEMVKAKTVDLMVPAQAEIVLEGHITTTETRPEGPYGEWMGYFEEEMLLPVFKLSAITHRQNPLYLMTIEGPTLGDAEMLRMVPQIATFTAQARERISGFVDAWLPVSGRNYMAIVSIKKRYPGWGKTAIYQTFALPYVASSANFVVVVDHDIDVRDMDEVIWALSTRVDPVHDVIITPPMGGYALNPAASRRDARFLPTSATDVVMSSKIGIDATLKTSAEGRGRPSAKVVRPKVEMYERVISQWTQYGFKPI
jgi:4-hydroxy-3-polyprenylbenzoate decarboxylase